MTYLRNELMSSVRSQSSGLAQLRRMVATENFGDVDSILEKLFAIVDDKEKVLTLSHFTHILLTYYSHITHVHFSFAHSLGLIGGHLLSARWCGCPARCCHSQGHHAGTQDREEGTRKAYQAGPARFRSQLDLWIPSFFCHFSRQIPVLPNPCLLTSRLLSGIAFSSHKRRWGQSRMSLKTTRSAQLHTPNSPSPDIFLTRLQEALSSCLMYALKNGKAHFVELLLKHGAQPWKVCTVRLGRLGLRGGLCLILLPMHTQCRLQLC